MNAQDVITVLDQLAASDKSVLCIGCGFFVPEFERLGGPGESFTFHLGCAALAIAEYEVLGIARLDAHGVYEYGWLLGAFERFVTEHEKRAEPNRSQP